MVVVQFFSNFGSEEDQKNLSETRMSEEMFETSFSQDTSVEIYDYWYEDDEE